MAQPQIAWEEIGWNMDLHGITETKSCVLVCDGIFYAAIMSSERGGDESITPFGPDRSSLDEAMQDVKAGPAAFGQRSAARQFLGFFAHLAKCYWPYWGVNTNIPSLHGHGSPLFNKRGEPAQRFINDVLWSTFHFLCTT